MAPSLKCGSVWRQLPLICGIFACAFLVITVPGAGALKFLNEAPFVLPTILGYNLDINCTTDEPNATVRLLHQPSFPNWVERTVTPNKLILRGQVFTLLNVIVTDGGRYNCEATYKNQTIRWSKVSGTALIDTGSLPRHFKLIPEKPIIVLQGGTGQIICEARGTSVSKLQWKKVLSPSVEQSVPGNMVVDIKDEGNNLVKAILKVTNAQAQDTGEYKCLLTAYGKTARKLTRIRVDARTPPNIESFSGEKTIKEGTEKVIKCVSKASPRPTVNWYRNGKKLNVTNCTRIDDKSCDNVIYEVYDENPGSALHTTYSTQVLKIRSALYPRDQGKFVCKATNGNDPPAELEFDLNVQVPPILKTPHSVNAPLLVPDGETKEVSCSLVKANPLPTFTWEYKNKNCGKNCEWAAVPGKLVLTPTNRPTNESVVQVTKEQQTAYYRCNATNSEGMDSYTVPLIRLAKQKDWVEFDPNSETQHNEKSMLRLVCFDRCGICPFRPNFARDGVKLSPENDARVNVTYYKKTDQEPENRLVLTIKDLTLNDTGNYSCISSVNPKIYFDDIYITINRLVAPKVVVVGNKTILQGAQWQTQLFCNATGHPKPEITWFFYKDGKTIQVNTAGSELQGDPDRCKKRTDDFYFLRRNAPEHLVICNPKKRHTGEYKCRAVNPLDKKEGSAFINVQMKPEILEPKVGYKTAGMEIGATLNLTCRADGNPLPNVTWLMNRTGEVSETKQGSQQLIKSLAEDDFGIYTCIARNHLDKQEVSIEVVKVGSTAGQKLDEPLSTGALVGISIGVGVVVLVVLIICLVVYRRQKKQIDEYKEIYFLRQSDYQIDPDRSLLEQCNDLPYDPDWEFPEERLILGDVLGAGAFGQVVRAEAIGILALSPRDKTAESFKRRSKIRRSSRAKDLKKEDIGGGWKNTKLPVAVKTLKEGATEAEYKDLASELKILIHLGQHKNIINLLGACTRGKRLMVIMEFAPHGSLLSFLRSKRDIYEPDWTKTINDPQKEFTLVDLVMAGYQVSRGMAFLATKKCVHRDLAARNILVGDDYVMKIADFGLARDIYKDELYVKKTQGLLPVKWMAPESLFDRVYTEKTDVWSFGILLWEVFTLGGTPYPGLPTEQLLDYLSDGKRMDNPAKCPLEVYTVMRDCWIHEPEQRPHFTTLNERLGKILERNMTKENPYLALQMDDDDGAASQGYYLEPCDSGLRDSKRYVESPVHSPSTEVPNTVGEGDGARYDSPLPVLPPGLAIISDEDIQKSPLPPIPPSYEDAMSDEAEAKPRSSGSDNSAAGESGIDINGEDDGGDYIDDSRDDSPFLPREGNKPVAIPMSDAAKVPEAEVLIKGQRKKIETAL